MARSFREGCFLAQGYFDILSPIGEMLREKEPFTLIVTSPLKARSEVLEWAKQRAVIRTRVPRARVKIRGMKVLPRKNCEPRQLSLF